MPLNEPASLSRRSFFGGPREFMNYRIRDRLRRDFRQRFRCVDRYPARQLPRVGSELPNPVQSGWPLPTHAGKTKSALHPVGGGRLYRVCEVSARTADNLQISIR